MGSRGTPCTICTHRERAALDLALARGVAATALARRYELSPDALYRHRKAHLTPAVRVRLLAGPRLEGVDLEHLREAEGQSWLASLIAIRQRLFAALDLAEEAGDVNQIVRVTSQLHQNLSVVGQHLGELSVGNHTTNILIQPQYLNMRVAIVDVLRDFPQAAQAVAAVLVRLEEEAATEITEQAERKLGQ